eukprot:46860-Heterocapsa_arctica.AAC.2
MDRDKIVELMYRPAPAGAAPMETDNSIDPMAMDPEDRRRRLLDDVPKSTKKARAEQARAALHPVPEDEFVHQKAHHGERKKVIPKALHDHLLNGITPSMRGGVVQPLNGPGLH